MCNENEKDARKNELDNIKELGITNIPKMDEKIYVLPIIGQIEGHMAVTPQTKSTKYEHPNLP